MLQEGLCAVQPMLTGGVAIFLTTQPALEQTTDGLD